MRILLSGYYGLGNLGDEALLAGIGGALAGRGHEVVVLSADPAATEALHGLPAAHRLHGVLPALLRCDAFVSGGGGLLQDRSSGRSLAYYLGLLRLARLAGKSCAVFGQSVGPLSARGQRQVASALRRLPVGVRDEPSRRLLAPLGVEAELVADGALLLEPPTVTPAADAPTVLVPRHGHPELTAALVDAGRALRRAGRPLALLAIQPLEDADEMARLAAALPEATPLAAGDHREALALLAAARFVISARLHGLILAAVAGRGYCGLVYDPKVAGFLELAGAPAFAAPVDRDALVRVALEQPLPPPDARDALRRRAQAGIDWLERALTSRWHSS